MSSAEVMTTALVATICFDGNHEKARSFLLEHGYIPAMLSKGQFNRRLHALPDTLWQALWYILAEITKASNPTGEYIVDSCPVPVCDNIRIRRGKIYRDEAFRGKVASKRRFIYGLKVHLLVTATGHPVEIMLAPASVVDVSAFKGLPLDLPEGSELYADAAYTDYKAEDFLRDEADVALIAARKKNSKRPHPGYVQYLADRVRKRIETTFSVVTERFGDHVHAVTPRGFELKVFLTFLAYAILG